MHIILRAGALALALLSCAPALAQGAVGKAIIAPLGTSIPAQAIYCDDGSGNAALCTFGGGGGGGGTAGTEYTEDAVAPANPIGGIVQARRRDTLTTSEVSADGDVISLNATNRGELRTSDAAVAALLGSPLSVNTHAVTQSGGWTVGLTGAIPTGANTIGSIGNSFFGARLQDASGTALGTVGNPVYTSPTSTANGTVGSAAPTTAAQHAGRDPVGNLRAFATDTGGRLLPGQGVVASTSTTLAASTATSIGAAAGGRIGLSVFAEAALTANLYLCTTQTTGCSATSYDFLVPSGAGAGTIYTSLFAPNTSIYAYTTGTPVVVVNSWTAQ